MIRAQSTNIITAVCYGDWQRFAHTNFLVLRANTETDNSICEWCFVGCSRCESSCRWGHSKRGLVVIIPHVESGDFAYLTCCCQSMVNTCDPSSSLRGFIADLILVICGSSPILVEQCSTVYNIEGKLRWSGRLGTHNNTHLYRFSRNGTISVPANFTGRSIYRVSCIVTRGAVSSWSQWTIVLIGSRSWTIYAKEISWCCGATLSVHRAFIGISSQIWKCDFRDAIEDIDTKGARSNRINIIMGFISHVSSNKYSYSRCIACCGCVKAPVFSLIYLIEGPIITVKPFRASCISRVFLIAEARTDARSTPNEELTANI